MKPILAWILVAVAVTAILIPAYRSGELDDAIILFLAFSTAASFVIWAARQQSNRLGLMSGLFNAGLVCLALIVTESSLAQILAFTIAAAVGSVLGARLLAKTMRVAK